MCPTPIEGLATNGIVHFDPDAYIRDGASQYVSEQDMYLPFDRPLYATPYPAYAVPVMRPEQPHKDVYIRHEKHSSFSWGTALISAIVGGIATFLGYELLKDKDNKTISSAASEVKSDIVTGAKNAGVKVKEKAKGFFASAKDFVVNCKDKVVSWFKGKKAESSVDKVVNEAAKNSNNVQTGFFKTRFRKTKIGLGIAAGLGVLYLVYKSFVGKSNHSSKE